MHRLLLTSLLLNFIAAPCYASLTLIHWYNKTGTGTDADDYPNKSMRGRFKGSIIYKNDNDPCIYEQKNIQYKDGDIKRGLEKFCNSRDDKMRNPVSRMGVSIPGDRKKLQADSVEPLCAMPQFQGKKGTICEKAGKPYSF